MPIIHINRKKDKYYLHESRTKKGNAKYFFSKSSDGKLLNKVPDGYEIYENPNAQVFLRKKVPLLITDAEINIIKDSITNNSGVKDYKIELRRATVTIYLPDQTDADLEHLSLDFQTNTALREVLLRNRIYTPMMRFELVDETKRTYVIERYYFSGEGGWMYLDSGDKLKNLSKQYCQHLGKDTFFELL